MFIGRNDILSDLETLWRKRTSSIVACRGRRRIGKSTLIREFARRTADVYIEIEGLAPSIEKPMTNQDGPMSGAELANALAVGRNGRFAELLKDLELGGFISSDPGLNPETGSPMRLSRYRLRDNYTRFYLKYVMPRKTEIETGTYKHASLEHLPEWNVMMGLQFENLVVNNAMDIVPLIGIGNATVESAAPYSNSRKKRNGEPNGCQIDLLVQTPKTAYVVEVKRKNFIDSSIEDEVRRKMNRLPLRPGMTIRPVLVYAGELAKSVEADGYFDALIPANKLLGR